MLLNLSRFEEVLARSGFSALVATTPQNVQYAAGYESERLHNFVALQNYVVMPPGADEFCLVLPSTEMVHLSSKETNASQLARYGSFYVMVEPGATLTPEETRLDHLLATVPSFSGPVQALAETLKRSGLAKGRIGIDENNFPWPHFETLRELLPDAKIEPAAWWFSFMRMFKTEGELALLRKSCAINEEALQAALSAIEVGASEEAAYAAFRTSFTVAGGRPRLWGTSSGQNSSCFFWPGDRPLEDGDLMRIDCGGTYKGYWSDTGITAVCGSARTDHVKAYEALKLAVEAGIEVAKPGNPISAIGEAVMSVAHREGLRDLERHHCGHGVGLELYEPPMLLRAGGQSDIFAGGFENQTLEPGMVVNIEAPYYRLGFGGIHLEHTVLITPTGPELLTGNRDLHVSG